METERIVLPRRDLHATTPPRRSRLLAIGDIHGQLVALRALIDFARVSENDRVVLLGDYVDGGPDSAGVLDFLADFARGPHVVALRGNHDLMLAGALGSDDAFAAWIQAFGEGTASSYGIADAEHLRVSIRARHAPFLAKLRSWYETEHHIFVHAAVDYDQEMRAQDEHTLLWRKIAEAPPAHQSGKTVVFGHTAQRHGLPRDFGTAICIDTDAKRGGWLTALDVETRRCWQSDPSGNLREFALE